MSNDMTVDRRWRGAGAEASHGVRVIGGRRMYCAYEPSMNQADLSANHFGQETDLHGARTAHQRDWLYTGRVIA